MGVWDAVGLCFLLFLFFCDSGFGVLLCYFWCETVVGVVGFFILYFYILLVFLMLF